MNNVSFEKLKLALRELVRTIDGMEETKRFTGLDKDLLKQKLTSVYQEVLNLPTNASGDEGTSSNAHPVETEAYPELPRQVNRSETIETKAHSANEQVTGYRKTASKEPPKEKSEKTTEPVSLTKTQDSISEAHLKTEPLSEGAKSGKTSVIGEKFHESRKLIHDELAEKFQGGKKDLSSALQSKPIENIEKAIGINDKFLFIKELFSNNGQLYKETVDRLNQAVSLDEATGFLHENFHWNPEDPVVEKFLDLVRRRHL